MAMQALTRSVVKRQACLQRVHLGKYALSWPSDSRRRRRRRVPIRTLSTAPFANLHSAEGGGVAGVRGLHKPGDFKVLAEAAIAESERTRHKIARGASTLPAGLLRDLDAISNALCSAIDVAEFCRSTHEDPEFRAAADEAFSAVYGYIQELNTDVRLYEALRGLTEDKDAMSGLSAEQRRMAELLQAEFEGDGIHLSAAGRREVVEIKNEIVGLETRFNGNILTKQSTVEVEAASLRGIPPHLLGMDSFATAESFAGRITLSTEQHVSNLVLWHSKDSGVRRDMYMAANTAAHDNVKVLEELMAARHRLARLLGYESFAHHATHHKMAGSPEAVVQFLYALAERVKGKVAQELDLLREAKLAAEGDATLQAWDLPRYMGLVRRAKEVDGRAISRYLPLEACLDGLRLLCGSLFGIRLEEVPMSSSEAWARSPGTALRKLTLSHPSEGPLGTVYLDLHRRPGKYAHAAHFTLRCGCQVDAGSGTSAPRYQLPVVALVCNFAPPVSEGTPCLLGHGELETLFHEFGHALHSLLSRTESQHLSGTRTAPDFVEVPSHILEYFAWDPRVVSKFARDYRTGQPMPEGLMQGLADSRYLFAGIDMQTQILYAMLDLKLFGEQPQGGVLSSTEVLNGLQRELTSIPPVEGALLQARFGHLTGYGAGYYAYLYARLFASNVWDARFAADPLSSNAGGRLWKELLRHGGAAEPKQMLRSLLDGREPSVDPLLSELGIG